ncbi:MAG: sulfite exporter TauE/SafE family protein [Thermaurantimonas sp.]
MQNEVLLNTEWWMYALYLIGGVLTGIINVLAGNGSAITLSLMIFAGMPPGLANGTNRIGAMVQTITSVLAIRKTLRTRRLIQLSVPFFLPAFIGSFLGAFIVMDIDDFLLKQIIGILMIFILLSLLLNPKKWKRKTDPKRKVHTWVNYVWFFLIGVYTGFIQMGVGIMMLAIMVLSIQLSLKDSNIIKLILALVISIPAFLVFVAYGQVHWPSGLVLALGQSVGSVISARYFLYHPHAMQITRNVLILILVLSILKLFQII